MEFRCRLGTPGGDIIEGTYVADNEARLRRDFEEKGLYILGIQRAGGLSLASFGIQRRRRIATREFLVFNQELATLLKAGMPLVQSLDILRQRVTNPIFKSVLDDVYERVRSGSSLSESFEAQGTMFPGIYTASLLAGEKSGSLELVLRRYVTYVKVVSGVKRKTISALVYPAILLVLSLIVVAMIVLKVVPAFGSFYEQAGGAQLPLSTRIIVALSKFAGTYFSLLVLMVVAAAAGFWFWIRQPGSRVRFDRWVLRVPMLGSISQKFGTSQAARTLATLLGGGIPLVNAIDIASRSIQNHYLAHELQRAAQQVREGRALAASMNDSGAFPDVAIKMVEVGEQTGALQEMLNSLADFYDEEIETNLGRFITIIEPALLVIMGIVIAGLLLSLYMPLFQMSSALG
ncbi:MAG: type II secretion system F family protein [Vicinamibacterales bacterium]